MGKAQDYLNRNSSIHGERSPDEIRSEIERTRSELNSTVDAIEERISPERFRFEMKKNIRIMGYYAQDAIRMVGTRLVEEVKHIRLPTALLLVGLSWLMIGVTRESRKKREKALPPMVK